ncbi:MAG: flagellar export chaperone FliS [Terriglobales bacterium]
MKKSQTELTYLRAAAKDATAVGLVIILYDLLVHDLEQAIAAIATGDVEKRTAEIKHSFLVLQQLEGSLDHKNGGIAAKHLAGFYSALRSKILEAHIKVSPDILRRQIELVFDVRQAWQQVDKPNLGPADSTPEQDASDQPTGRSMAAAAGAGEVTSMNWTA